MVIFRQIVGLTMFLVFISTYSSKAQTTLLDEDFDGVTVPILPNGWTTSVFPGGTVLWSTSNAIPNSGPNSANLTIPSGNFALNSALESTNISTTGFSNITVSWRARNEIGDDVFLEYAINAKSGWTSSGVSYTPGTTAGSYTLETATLPSAVNNQGIIFIRWVMLSTTSGDTYYLDDVIVQGTASSSTTYYSIAASNTNLDDLASWSDAEDETGSAPTDFTSAGSIFMVDDAGSTFDANWPASGTIENIEIVNGADLTIPSTSVLDGTVNVNNGGSLRLENATLPTLGVLGELSTVVYAQGVALTIEPKTYGNLAISNSGIYSTGNNVTVRGTLMLESGRLVLSTNETQNFTLEGTITRISGSIDGSSTSNLTLSGTADVDNLRFTPGTTELRQLSIAKSGATVDMRSALTIANTLSITSATLNVNSNILTINSAVSLSSGIIASTEIGTVVYNSPGDGQAIISGNYGNLTFSDFTKVLPASGEINVSGTFTPGTASGHITTGSTIVFTGTSQTIPDFEYNNLTISTGNTVTVTPATLNLTGNFTNGGTFTAPTTMTVGGDFNNTGTFNRNGGLVEFNGSVTQSITSSSLIEFDDLTISNNSAQVSLSATADLFGRLSMAESSSFDADGAGSGVLTVRSTGLASDASIGTIPATATFTGDVSVQRFIDGTSDGDFRYLSSPITNANLGMWRSVFPITGDFSDASSTSEENVVSTSSPSVYLYNSTVDGYEALTASGGPTSDVALANGVGYVAFTYLSTDHIPNMRGTIGQGNVNIPVSNVAGRFNLVGNPYPSTLDGETAVNGSAGSLNSTFYIRTADNVFASYNAASSTPLMHPNGAAWEGEISLGQAFWVESSGGGTNFSISEEMKVGQGNGQFLREGQDFSSSVFFISLSGAGMVDETAIVFNVDATDGLEVLDGQKFTNGNFDRSTGMYSYLNLSSFNDDQSINYVFNAVNSEQCDRLVNLRINDTPIGDYQLNFDNWERFFLPYNVKLIDNFSNNEVTLTEGYSYDFQVTSDANSFGGNRFDLVFTAKEIDTSANLNPVIDDNCSDTFFQLTLENTVEGVIYTVLVDNVPISNEIISTSTTTEIFVAKEAVGFGTSILSVMASSPFECFDDHVFNDITSYDLIQYDIEDVINGNVCEGGSVEIGVMGTSDLGAYRWYQTEDSDAILLETTNGSFSTPEIEQTTSYFVSAVSPDGCESERVEVVAEVVTIETPEIEIIDGVLVVNTNESYTIQWLRDGEPIQGANSNSLIIDGTGTYNAEVSNGICTAFSPSEIFEVTGVSDLLGEKELRVFPNPVKDFLTVEVDNLSNTDPLEFKLFDLSGTELDKQREISITSTNKGVRLDLSRLHAGFYILLVKNQEGLLPIKIFKE